MGSVGQGVGWGAQVRQGGGKYLERYRAEEGFKDTIRILPVPKVELPIKIGVHFSRGAGFSNCTLDVNCPACERFGERGIAKYVVPLVLLKRKDVKQRKEEKLNKVMRWVFGADKLCQIRDMVLPELDDPKDIHKRDLVISCHDQQFQRLAINIANKTGKLPRDVAEHWKGEGLTMFSDWIDTDFTPESIVKRLDSNKADNRSGGERQSHSGRYGGSSARVEPASRDLDDDDLDSVLANL